MFARIMAACIVIGVGLVSVPVYLSFTQTDASVGSIGWSGDRLEFQSTDAVAYSGGAGEFFPGNRSHGGSNVVSVPAPGALAALGVAAALIGTRRRRGH
ncbi:MAG: PEP-CTERM sorting domain-containing protein [Planctomycetota bacterium]